MLKRKKYFKIYYKIRLLLREDGTIYLLGVGNPRMMQCTAGRIGYAKVLRWDSDAPHGPGAKIKAGVPCTRVNKHLKKAFRCLGPSEFSFFPLRGGPLAA